MEKSETEAYKAELAERLVNIMEQMCRETPQARHLLSYKLLANQVKHLRQYSLFLQSSDWEPPTDIQIDPNYKHRDDENLRRAGFNPSLISKYSK